MDPNKNPYVELKKLVFPDGEVVWAYGPKSFQLKDIDFKIDDFYDELVDNFLSLGYFKKEELILKDEDKPVEMLAGIINRSEKFECDIFGAYSFNKGAVIRFLKEVALISDCLHRKEFVKSVEDNGSIYKLLNAKTFLLMRSAYLNLGRLHTLYLHEEYRRQAVKKSSSEDVYKYLPDVKKIVLDLLDGEVKRQGKKFATMESAVKAIEHKFEDKYSQMQDDTGRYTVAQKFFNSSQLKRKLSEWKVDQDFKSKLSGFVRIGS